MKSEIKSHLQSRQFQRVIACLEQLTPGHPLELLDYAAAQIAKIPRAELDRQAPLRCRLALLGGSTTQFYVPFIRLFCLQRGLQIEIFESAFGLYEQEVWAPSPDLLAFDPQLIHFLVSARNLSLPPYAAEPEPLVREQATRFLQLYRTARERFGCPLIVNNFETAAERPLGGLDCSLPGTRNRMIRAINAAVASDLPAQVHIHDIEQLSSACGKYAWSDAKLWNETKTAVSFEFQPHYAHRLSATLGALFGRSKKCLVLDLDNTLWGGVIGDDGLQGIKFGAGQAEGEAFFEFQTYVKALQERGVLLAIASKNEPENALLPFREHPEFVLREADFACVVAGWGPKDESLRLIAQQLNIGLDALVFFDDNPAERQLVSDSLPAVTVIDVPPDPSLYLRALDDRNLFEALSVTQEDRLRADFFQSNSARAELAAGTHDYEEYLRKLGMRAVVEPVSHANKTRVTQLINKTNQFNLTTLRMTEPQVEALIDARDAYTSTIRLDDKFGANGLISVVVGQIRSDALHINNWLMSCRVLKRGVEQLELERLLGFCRARSLHTIVGQYKPTEKNRLVKNHYAELGFAQVSAAPELTVWQYALGEQTFKPHHHIAV